MNLTVEYLYTYSWC